MKKTGNEKSFSSWELLGLIVPSALGFYLAIAYLNTNIYFSYYNIKAEDFYGIDDYWSSSLDTALITAIAVLFVFIMERFNLGPFSRNDWQFTEKIKEVRGKHPLVVPIACCSVLVCIGIFPYGNYVYSIFMLIIILALVALVVPVVFFWRALDLFFAFIIWPICWLLSLHYSAGPFVVLISFVLSCGLLVLFMLRVDKRNIKAPIKYSSKRKLLAAVITPLMLVSFFLFQTATDAINVNDKSKIFLSCKDGKLNSCKTISFVGANSKYNFLHSIETKTSVVISNDHVLSHVYWASNKRGTIKAIMKKHCGSIDVNYAEGIIVIDCNALSSIDLKLLQQ